MKCYRENRNSDCPTCKHPLSETQLFPDNYANREIQSLAVRCPNTKLGCGTVVELRNVQVCRDISVRVYRVGQLK